MEHNTIKKILIGLFFCVVLFALSFLMEEKSKTADPPKEDQEMQVVADDPEAKR